MTFKQDMFVIHYAPTGISSKKKAIFSAKVTVKVRRSFTLVSFEMASCVEYAC